MADLPGKLELLKISDLSRFQTWPPGGRSFFSRTEEEKSSNNDSTLLKSTEEAVEAGITSAQNQENEEENQLTNRLFWSAAKGSSGPTQQLVEAGLEAALYSALQVEFLIIHWLIT